jgi:hypothetical protein
VLESDSSFSCNEERLQQMASLYNLRIRNILVSHIFCPFKSASSIPGKFTARANACFPLDPLSIAFQNVVFAVDNLLDGILFVLAVKMDDQIKNFNFDVDILMSS